MVTNVNATGTSLQSKPCERSRVSCGLRGMKFFHLEVELASRVNEFCFRPSTTRTRKSTTHSAATHTTLQRVILSAVNGTARMGTNGIARRRSAVLSECTNGNESCCSHKCETKKFAARTCDSTSITPRLSHHYVDCKCLTASCRSTRASASLDKKTRCKVGRRHV